MSEATLPLHLRLQLRTRRELLDELNRWLAMEGAAWHRNDRDGIERTGRHCDAILAELDRRTAERKRRKARKIERLHALAQAEQEHGR
jgi:hypothetical protein